MKRTTFLFLLYVGLACLKSNAQPAPPVEATTTQVGAGTLGYPFVVTPRGLAGWTGGGSGGAVSYNTTGFPSGTRGLIFVGDSLTQEAYSSTHSWPFYLTNSYLGNMSYNFRTNAGQAGETLAAMLAEYNTKIHPWVQADGTNAIVFLWAGVNDLGSSAESIFTSWTNYCALVHTDGGKVVAFTLTTGATLGAGGDVSRVKFNNYVRTATNWDYLVDVGNFVPPPPDETFYEDGDATHFSDTGYDNIAWNVGQVLQRPERQIFLPARDSATRNYRGSYLLHNQRNTLLLQDDTFPGFMQQLTGGDWSQIGPFGGALYFIYHVGNTSVAAGDTKVMMTTTNTIFTTPVLMQTNSLQSPTANAGYFYVSNNVDLYWVTTSKTNLVVLGH